MKDAQLRMLFVCADPAIPRESQIVFALKTLCGFSVDEIALRLFQNNEAIYKRLQRARATLREQREQWEGSFALDTPAIEALATRLPAVLHIVYLLFTEGYSSAQPDTVIRRELCEEAVRLGLLLAEHPVGAVPETDALLALMYLDAARFDARVDGAGGLLLLEEQDRARWDRELIHMRHRASAPRGAWRRVFPLSRRGGHRGRTLPRADLRRDPLGRNRAPLRVARWRRAVADQHAEPIDRRRRMAGPRGGARAARIAQAAHLAPRLLPLGCDARRAVPPQRRSRAARASI